MARGKFRLGPRTPDGKLIFKSEAKKALSAYNIEIKGNVSSGLASEHLTADGHRRSELYDGTILGDLLSRGTNANESVNPVLAITEASERWMWEHLVPWVFGNLENGNLMLDWHSKGIVYVHKLPLSAFLPYCNGNDISRMLEKGLQHAGTITSRPPKHFGSALMMASNFLTLMQMYYTGAQAFGAIEMWLAPFIAKDKLGYGEVENYWQMFYHTMNLPFRASGGTPFTNNTVLVWSGQTIRDRLALVGGEKAGRLGDYMDEAWLNFKAIFTVERKGGAKGEPFTYPIQNVMYSEELDEKLLEDPEAFEAFFGATGEKGAPYIENSMRVCEGKKCLDPDSTQAMCCRLLSDKDSVGHKKRLLQLLDELPKWIRSKIEPLIEEGSEDYELEARGVFSMADQTGSKGIVSINLPLLAYEAKGDFERFIDLLIERMRNVRDFLIAWHKWYVWLRWHKYPNVFAFPNFYQTLEEFERDYYLTFGAVGMPEMATILTGEKDLYVSDDYEAQIRATEEYIKPTIITMSALAGIWSDPHAKRYPFPLNFNVEEVPAETAFSKMFIRNKKRYGDDLMRLLPEEVIQSHGYANTIYPYYGYAPIMVKAKIEGIVQRYFTGGVMHHFWMGETLSPEVTRKVVLAILRQKVINFSISPLICLQQNGKKRCFTRIVGWMVPIDQFNDYRRKEFEFRGFHTSDGLERYKYEKSVGAVEKKEKITNVDPFKGIL